MEQAAMVYDNPSVHSGRLRDSSRHPLAPDKLTPLFDDREAAVHGMSTLSSDPLLRLLGTMRMGAILVSGEGRIAYLNEAAKEALTAQLGLALRGDQVVVTSPEARRRFLTVLNNACNAPYLDGALLLNASGLRRALRVVSIARMAGRDASSATANLTTHSAAHSALPISRNGAGLALLCLGSSRSHAPDATLLTHLFGLTGAESALMAAIAGGERLHACAARRGVSLATVRAQLRNVFVKTGAATQSELTFIAWSIPGLWIA